MSRDVATLIVFGGLLAGCMAGVVPVDSTSAATEASPGAVATTTAGPGGGSLISCDQVEPVYAAPEMYADEPMYVANEMPADEVRAWAEVQPGFESIWIDRDHNGWITVAFSQDAAARQADLEREFPGVGMVAVEVDWSVAELGALQNRVFRELRTTLDSFGTFTMEDKGVVVIQVGVLTDELRAELGTRFESERVCVSGVDPSTVPPAGPQPQGGDGWRLLFDGDRIGRPYRTGIAFDAASLEDLWAEIGIGDPIPEVDFVNEVVIWFGAVYGSGCSHIRLDHVVVTDAILHPLIVLPGPPAGCNLDANPHAYVVAVERSKLPAGPFVIQLQAEDPPRGATEERTVVNADLSQPGTVAAPGQVGLDPNFPPPFFLESGDFIEPDYPAPYLLDARCGIEWLGELNDYSWRTTEGLPPAWSDLTAGDGTIETSILLVTDPEPLIEVTAGDVTLTYRPTEEPVAACP